MRVGVVGQVVVDQVLRLRGERTSYRWDVESAATLLGGTGANVATLYALLGCATTLFTIADDAHADHYAHLEAAGVALHRLATGTLATNYSIFFAGEPRATMALSPVLLAPGQTATAAEVLHAVVDHTVLHVTPTVAGLAEDLTERWLAGDEPNSQASRPLRVLSPAAEFFDHDAVFFARLSKPYDLVCMDLAEARVYAGLAEDADAEAAFAVFAQRPSQCVVITDGALGAHAIYRGRYFHRPAEPSGDPVVDTLGCGDVFAAAFGFALAQAREEHPKEMLPGFTKETIAGALTFATWAARLMASIPGMWTGMLDDRTQFTRLAARSLGDTAQVTVANISPMPDSTSGETDDRMAAPPE